MFCQLNNKKTYFKRNVQKNFTHRKFNSFLRILKSISTHFKAIKHRLNKSIYFRNILLIKHTQKKKKKKTFQMRYFQNTNAHRSLIESEKSD